MSNFTSEQIRVLLKNKNIQSCTTNSITYTKEFKIKAVEEYGNGLSPNTIFKQAGIDLNIIGKEQSRWCLKRWRKIYRTRGSPGLQEQRGKNGEGRPKVRDPDDIEYLKTKIKYLEAENSFLKKLKTNKSH